MSQVMMMMMMSTLQKLQHMGHKNLYPYENGISNLNICDFDNLSKII